MTSGCSRDINIESEAVATSTCKGKEVATSSAQERRSRHQSEVATAVVKKRGRDNTWLSRQQFHRKEVATTPGCRDINCEEQKVTTTSSCRDIKYKEKRGRDKIKLSRHQLHLRHVATKQRLLRQRLRQQRSRQGLDVATVSTNWAS